MTYFPAFPMAIQGVYSSPAGTAALLATSIFTYVPDSVIWNTLDVVPNQDQSGAICQRTGKWYGDTQLTIDGTGKLVGKDRALKGGYGWDF